MLTNLDYSKTSSKHDDTAGSNTSDSNLRTDPDWTSEMGRDIILTPDYTDFIMKNNDGQEQNNDSQQKNNKGMDGDVQEVNDLNYLIL